MADAKVVSFRITSWAGVQTMAVAAVRRVGVEVLRDARLLAPRSPRQPPVADPSQPVTGNLKNSLNVDYGLEGNKAVATVGTPVAYGVYQEFGTRSIPARPYLGPALEAARRKYGGR